VKKVSNLIHFRVGDWKLLIGKPGPAADDNGWYPPPTLTQQIKPFDPYGDPTEQNGIRGVQEREVVRDVPQYQLYQYQLYNIKGIAFYQ
jgi:hypothetical protein